MKKFDIELAKKHHPVQTRDGRPVRILCFDKKDSLFPIVALIPEKISDEVSDSLNTFTAEGKVCSCCDSRLDLFMAPVKKEGWVNIYNGTGNIPYTGAIYPSEEKARAHIMTCGNSYLATHKLEWEE